MSSVLLCDLSDSEEEIEEESDEEGTQTGRTKRKHIKSSGKNAESWTVKKHKVSTCPRTETLIVSEWSKMSDEGYIEPARIEPALRLPAAAQLQSGEKEMEEQPPQKQIDEVVRQQIKEDQKRISKEAGLEWLSCQLIGV